MAAVFKISNGTLNIGQIEEIVSRTLNYVDYVNKHYFFYWPAGRCVMQSIPRHSFFHTHGYVLTTSYLKYFWPTKT